LKIEKIKIGLETFKTEDGFLKLLHEAHVLFGNDRKFLEEATYEVEIKFIDGEMIGKTTFKYQPLKKRLEKYLPYNPV